MDTTCNDENNTNGKLLKENDAKDDIVEVEFDRLLKDYVGEGGRYQMSMAILLAWTAFPCSLAMMELVFLNLAPTHYCDVTPLSSALSALNNSELMYLSIPNKVAFGDGYEPEVCVQYDRNYTEATIEDIQRWRTDEANYTKTITCSSWTYEESRIDDTITTEVSMIIWHNLNDSFITD